MGQSQAIIKMSFSWKFQGKPTTQSKDIMFPVLKNHVLRKSQKTKKIMKNKLKISRVHLVSISFWWFVMITVVLLSNGIYSPAWSKSILRLKNKVILFCCCTSYCALIIKHWSGKNKCYGLKILNQARLRREGNNQINHLRNFLREVSICLWSST